MRAPSCGYPLWIQVETKLLVLSAGRTILVTRQAIDGTLGADLCVRPGPGWVTGTDLHF